MSARPTLARRVAQKMLRDPQFRYDVEQELSEAAETIDASLKGAASVFEIGEDSARIWVWINGLNTYGEGDTWAAARYDTMLELDYVLDKLWAAYQRRRRIPGADRPIGDPVDQDIDNGGVAP